MFAYRRAVPFTLKLTSERLLTRLRSTTPGTSPKLCNDVARTSKPDQLFTKVELEIRGHDKAVLKSYTTFLTDVCKHLELDVQSVVELPYVRWLQNTLRAKFAKKKNQLHYETRTYIRLFTVRNLTGSTSKTFLEYIERNLPEGVAMKVTYDELLQLPGMITRKMDDSAIIDASDQSSDNVQSADPEQTPETESQKQQQQKEQTDPD